jgi:hypothetical protein
MKTAYTDLMDYLSDFAEEETVEGIVFGDYGWDGYKEDGLAVPNEKKGILMTLEEAKPMMNSWRFYGGHGAPECYAVYIWTNKRVIWVTQYDGATTLDSAPRNPCNIIPEMPGG